jgi:hypothetical protein
LQVENKQGLSSEDNGEVVTGYSKHLYSFSYSGVSSCGRRKSQMELELKLHGHKGKEDGGT